MMQIYPDKLAAHLQQNLLPVYLVAGDEMLLQNDACDLVRQAASAQGYNEVEKTVQEPAFDWSSWLNSGNALSLFAEKRLLELRLNSSKIGAEGSKAIVRFCENPPPDTVLLIISPRIEGKPKWLNALNVYVPIYPLDAQALPRWLVQRSGQYNIKLSNDASQLLAERVEGNLMAAVQELEKLSLGLPANSTVDADIVADAVADNARFSAFNMLDHAVQGHAQVACRALRHIREEGVEPVAIIGAIAHQLRVLLVLKSYQQQNNLNAGFKAQRIIARKQAPIKQALARLSDSGLQNCVRLASRADIQSKQGETPVAWLMIETILLHLAGHPLAAEQALLQEGATHQI